jgi:hypothetical protein
LAEFDTDADALVTTDVTSFLAVDATFFVTVSTFSFAFLAGVGFETFAMTSLAEAVLLASAALSIISFAGVAGLVAADSIMSAFAVMDSGEDPISAVAVFIGADLGFVATSETAVVLAEASELVSTFVHA